MKFILETLKASEAVTVGQFTIIMYEDGTIAARKTSNGLMSETQSRTEAGLRRLFDWMAEERNVGIPWGV